MGLSNIQHFVLQFPPPPSYYGLLISDTQVHWSYLLPGAFSVHSQGHGPQLHPQHPAHHASTPGGGGQSQDRKEAVQTNTPTHQAGIAWCRSATKICKPIKTVNDNK